ncbi:hypothetical protein RDI58_007092 [Solanum bulbocastanum]|uniref:Uncharacterized protein n=1 Tax=Solanum bulbocastanum TaxID=147425 RepID=A0AAN8TVV7_SOLBU
MDNVEFTPRTPSASAANKKLSLSLLLP